MQKKLKIKQVNFSKGLNYLIAALEELDKLMIPWKVNKKKRIITIEIPRFLPF